MLRDHVTWPRPRSRNRIVRLLRGIWTAPTNLIGHAAGLLVSGRGPRRVGGRAAAGWLYPIRRGIGLDWVGAVTLGHAILYTPRMFEGLEGRLTLTPHAAFYTPESLADMRRLAMTGVLEFLAHGRLRSCVNLRELRRHGFFEEA